MTFYLCFLCEGCLWDNAEPAIDLVDFEVLPSRRAFEALLATPFEVVLQAIVSPPF